MGTNPTPRKADDRNDGTSTDGKPVRDPQDPRPGEPTAAGTPRKGEPGTSEHDRDRRD